MPAISLCADGLTASSTKSVQIPPFTSFWNLPFSSFAWRFATRSCTTGKPNFRNQLHTLGNIKRGRMRKLGLLIFVLAVGAALSIAQTTPAASQSGSTTSDTTTTTTTKTVHHAKRSSAASTAAEKLDINTANKEQLEALPGIGEKYSQKIIDARPYRAKNELVSKHIIPKSVYEKVKA